MAVSLVMENVMRRCSQPLGFIVTTLLLAACAPEARSPIVQYVQSSGSGRLAGLTVDQIQKWMARHDAVAIRAGELCRPVEQSAAAAWAATTEGRVCEAAKRSAVFRAPSAVASDGKAFD